MLTAAAALILALDAIAVLMFAGVWLTERLRFRRELRAEIRQAQRVYALMAEYDLDVERAMRLSELQLRLDASSPARSPARRRSGAG